jgi:hypothetical protein
MMRTIQHLAIDSCYAATAAGERVHHTLGILKFRLGRRERIVDCWDLVRMDGRFRDEPASGCFPGFFRQPGRVAKVRENSIDRCGSHGGGREQAKRTGEPVRRRVITRRIAIGHGTDIGGQVFATPQHPEHTRQRPTSIAGAAQHRFSGFRDDRQDFDIAGGDIIAHSNAVRRSPSRVTSSTPRHFGSMTPYG